MGVGSRKKRVEVPGERMRALRVRRLSGVSRERKTRKCGARGRPGVLETQIWVAYAPSGISQCAL